MHACWRIDTLTRGSVRGDRYARLAYRARTRARVGYSTGLMLLAPACAPHRLPTTPNHCAPLPTHPQVATSGTTPRYNAAAAAIAKGAATEEPAGDPSPVPKVR
jgi:hypothetical protein